MTENNPLQELIARRIAAAGGWLPFDEFMRLALYAPGLGYYARGARTFGLGPGDGSDFVTAPELSPLFGRALAAQVAQAFDETGASEVWEFGAGSGALAASLLAELEQLGRPAQRYVIVDISSALRARQQQRLAAWPQVQWASALPQALRGVVIGNEVLDAMPVKLLARLGGRWHERGVALAPAPCMPKTPETPVNRAQAAIKTKASAMPGGPFFVWQDRPTNLRPPVEPEEMDASESERGMAADVVTEIHPQAQAFIATVAERLRAGGAGAAFFIDYGFPEAEYYHPQRRSGTLACHRAHRMDGDPLSAVGEKDITAHIDFTAAALAAQDAGLHVLGYTSQAHFLINCGLPALMEQASLPERAAAMKLLAEHEMGELFKVLGLATREWPALGFAAGDRTHRL